MSAPDSSSSPWQDSNEADPRRRHERHKTDSLRCDLGDVIDVSATGIRVAVKGKPPLQVGQTGKIRLRFAEGSLAVTGRAVWMRRTGFRRFQMGFEFLNVKKGVAAALDSLVRFGFIVRPDGATTPEPAAPPPSGPTRRKRRVRATVDIPNYYAILGVAVNSSEAEIREAYRKLARRLHPDVTNDPEGGEKFVHVLEAYNVLKDAGHRRRYDHKRRAG